MPVAVESLQLRLTTPTLGCPSAIIKANVLRVLQQCLATAPVESAVTVAPSVCAPYEEASTELQLSVRQARGGGYRQRAAFAEEVAEQFCGASAFGLAEQSYLEFTDADSFDRSCISLHRDVAVSCLGLGNLLNPGLFLANYACNAEPNTSHRGCSIAGMAHTLTMWAEFEHDRRQLQLFFCVRDTGMPWDGYKMTVSYNSIHSLVADAGSDTHGPEAVNRFFYLVLRWPPQVWQSYNVNERNTTGRLQNLSMVKDWVRVNSFTGCTPDVVANSPVLCIGFGKNHVDRRTLFLLLGRLKSRTKMRIHFGAVKKVWSESVCPNGDTSLPTLASFRANYALEALRSRGCVVTDQLRMPTGALLRDRLKWCFWKDRQATEEALDLLIGAVDERRSVCLLDAFDAIYSVRHAEQLKERSGGDFDRFGPVIPSSCLLVRKVIVTLTRTLLLPPEALMSNRVLREFGEENAIRCVFRDDDGTKLQGSTRCTQGRRADGQSSLVQDKVWETLSNGVTIAGRQYEFLAWSNSQMRDHGCYMYAPTQMAGEDGQPARVFGVREIRKWMGDFTATKNVPKLMSRMGQCFTQAQVSIELQADDWRLEDDVVGGEGHPETGEPYIYSDGIGRMSAKTAQLVADSIGVEPTPSAFQVRFKGFKGMLCVDPLLDATGLKVIFRKSQEKFLDPGGSSSRLEIVKYSMPSSVYLNRPLIMILDQVSQRQGRQTHRRVANRLHALLDQQLFFIADMLCSEDLSASALFERVPVKMDFRLMRQYGFELTREPFFRSLLLAIHRYNIKQQLNKCKVEVSPTIGRTMYGVMDETGQLQYGQVFAQYSRSLSSPGNDITVLTGRLMVTKNPCLVPGDVRLFEAVDIAELHHLVDVIVFPRFGPRPHPDEMAGSDLDGDEYAVFWDPLLMFDRNEQPMSFPKATVPDLTMPALPRDMIRFFLDYLQQDTIGVMCSAHLIAADGGSIFNEKCMAIAQKCAVAVDFPKTGQPAEPLDREEKSRLYPDYMQNPFKSQYRSQRLIGQIYRKSKLVEDVLDLGQFSVRSFCDADLCLDWAEMGENSGRIREHAARVRDRYVSFIQELLDTYGVADEASLVSGHMVTVRNRISDNEKDDFSFYNTEKLIELRYTDIRRRFRAEFFAEFGAEDAFVRTHADGRRELLDAPDALRHKAVAWYMVTYEPKASRGNVTGFRSFPWIVWDVLAHIKRQKTFARLGTLGTHALNEYADEQFPHDPIHDKLRRSIEAHCEGRQAQMGVDLRARHLPISGAVVERYCAHYDGLQQLLFVLCSWAREESVYTRSALRPCHVCLLFIQYGLGLLNPLQLPFLPERVDRLPSPGSEPLSLSLVLGKYLLDFIRFMASQEFYTRPVLSFRSGFDIDLRFCRGEWRHLSRAAFRTYHHVALTSRFQALQLRDAADETTAAGGGDAAWDFAEMDHAVMVDLDPTYNLDTTEAAKLLKSWSGVDYCSIRRPFSGQHRQEQALVSAAGLLMARQRLQRILMIDDICERLANGRNPAEDADMDEDI